MPPSEATMRRGASHQPIFSSSMSKGDATILTPAAPLERWRSPGIRPDALKPSTDRMTAANTAHLCIDPALLWLSASPREPERPNSANLPKRPGEGVNRPLGGRILGRLCSVCCLAATIPLRLRLLLLSCLVSMVAGEGAAGTNALKLEVLSKCGTSRARRSKLTLPHFTCDTPMFMPVGTCAAVKGMTTEELEALDCHLILANTYHLALQPGTDLVQEVGGIHTFMNWHRAMLTDSGGFQMVSLLKLAEITEEGVTFQSPADGSQMLLTPEKSIQLQNEIGADIIMALDDVVSSTTTGPRVEEAMHRTIRWIDRCIGAHQRPHDQSLFGIVQGGLDLDLRGKCCEELIKRNLPGYAVGGLSGGEAKDDFWKVVLHCTKRLPDEKPRYCMGVGYPIDLLVCVALGVDMFDCVYPPRTARFGVALSDEGNLQLKHKRFKADLGPIEKDCSCPTCKNFSRAYLHLIAAKEQTGARLITIHNIAYMMRLMKRARAAIDEGNYPSFVVEYMARAYPKADYPGWVKDALTEVGIKLKEAATAPE